VEIEKNKRRRRRRRRRMHNLLLLSFSQHPHKMCGDLRLAYKQSSCCPKTSIPTSSNPPIVDIIPHDSPTPFVPWKGMNWFGRSAYDPSLWSHNYTRSLELTASPLDTLVLGDSHLGAERGDVLQPLKQMYSTLGSYDIFARGAAGISDFLSVAMKSYGSSLPLLPKKEPTRIIIHALGGNDIRLAMNINWPPPQYGGPDSFDPAPVSYFDGYVAVRQLYKLLRVEYANTHIYFLGLFGYCVTCNQHSSGVQLGSDISDEIINNYNAFVSDLFSGDSKATIIDIQSKLKAIKASNLTQYESMFVDNIHFSAQGNALIVTAMQELIA
jgi:hypothetical protein